MIDASGGTNEKGEPVDIGAHDPLEDIDFVEEEMDLWLAGIVERNWESVERKSRSPDFDIDDALADMLSGFGASPKQIATVLRELEYPEDPIQWEDDHREELARLVRERTKPIVVAANKIDVAPEENVEKPRARQTCDPHDGGGRTRARRAADNDLVDYDPGDQTLEISAEVNDAQREALEGSARRWANGKGRAFRARSTTRSTSYSSILQRIRSRTRRSGPTAAGIFCPTLTSCLRARRPSIWPTPSTQTSATAISTP